MFEKSEMDAEPTCPPQSAGLNPLDPAVRAINDVVSAYYAEKTAKVLSQVPGGSEPADGPVSRPGAASD